MAKRAKMTVGEKVTIARMKEMYVLRELTLHKFRNDPFYEVPRRDAQKIDRAVNRLVNAAAWDAFYMREVNTPFDDDGEANVASKYGPRPAKKARRQ